MRPCIAIVAPSLAILGGQGVQADTLAELLAHEGYPLLFVPINPRFPKWLAGLRRVRFVRTLLNQALYLTSLWRLRTADVVHVFAASYWAFLLSAAPAIVAGRLFGKRVVLNYHSGEAPDHLRRWGLLVHPFVRAAHRLVVPSEFLREVFAEFGHEATVVPNVVELSRFHYRERGHLAPHLLSIRNLEPHYGVGRILEAFVRVRAKHPDATLTIAGYGSEERPLRKLAERLGIGGVVFAGRIEPDDVPGFYDRADVFVNASVIDNQPVSILEAFAAGVPVVTTPTGDIAHMVGRGERGVLVPPEDPEAIADAVELLLSHPQRAAELARSAHDALLAHGWPEARARWATVYEGTVA